LNFYEHHIGDWDSATAHLSLLEEAVYGRLIRLYYRTEKPIPADVNQACRLVRAVTKQERQAVQIVLSEFFVQGPDGWRQKRCDEEINRYREKCEKASRSADARWKRGAPHTEGNADAMRTHTEGNADAMRTHTEGNALQSPYTSNQKPSVSELGKEGGNGTRRKSAADRHREAVAIADEYANRAIAADLEGGIQRAHEVAVSPGVDFAVVDTGRVRAAAG
jgi:uncharacterized protein YdaU (DUF1376 family)